MQYYLFKSENKKFWYLKSAYWPTVVPCKASRSATGSSKQQVPSTAYKKATTMVKMLPLKNGYGVIWRSQPYRLVEVQIGRGTDKLDRKSLHDKKSLEELHREGREGGSLYCYWLKFYSCIFKLFGFWLETHNSQ